jgi:predicted alpha-1,2-mannosidase
MRLGLVRLLLVLALLATGCASSGDDDSADDGDNDDVSPSDDDAADDDDNNNDNDASPGDDDDNDDETPTDVLDYVDPFIGTGGLGYGYASAYPGVKTPFGMVSMNPNTTLHGLNYDFNHFSGYYHADTGIRGFTHTQIHGTGAADYGNLLIMPMTKKPSGHITEATFRSSFRHADESAHPGYYSVQLEDPGVFAELTATDLAGMARFRASATDDRYLAIYPSYSIEPGWVRNATFELDAEAGTASGMMDFWGPLTGRDGGIVIYYAMAFSEAVQSYGVWSDGVLQDGEASVEGADIGAYVGFVPGACVPFLVKTGLSCQSVEQARANLAAQLADWDFDAATAAAQDKWRTELSRIELTGGSEQQRRIFYTALYHAMFLPTDWTEANNRYFGFDRATHDAGARRYYTDFSMWDTFRTLHPLLNLIDPARSADMMQSLVNMYVQGGSIPKWPIAAGYTGCMIGTPADVVLADAYLKGVQDWDYETGYEGCFAHATGPAPDDGRPGLDEYIDQGWIAEDHQSKAVCDVLEYSYDDSALSKWAGAMGLSDDAAMFEARSHNYQNYFDAETGLLRPRLADGSFLTPFHPEWVFDEHYVEGDAWHWSFYAPHDPAGLIGLYGSEEAFVEKLNYSFEKAASGNNFAALPSIFYWHGNEPDIFNAFLFASAGRADLTQKWARWILASKYGDGPDGLPGNDDCGTMSAWYIFASLGFFPVAGSDRYVVASPLWEGATLHLPGGDLTISVVNAGAQNIYVQDVKLNGESLAEPFFTHDRIAQGGTIEFVMGATPAR